MYNFNITGFITDMQNSLELSTIVDSYEGFPAIAETFIEEPVGVYMTVCDLDLDYQYCDAGAKIRRGQWSFEVKIVGIDTTSRDQLRQYFNELHMYMRTYFGNDVYKVELNNRSNQLRDPLTERPFVSVIYTAYFQV